MEHHIDGRMFRVRVRSSKRARRALVSVPALDLVEVVLPRGLARWHATAILAEKEEWIRRRFIQLETIEQRSAQLGLRQADTVWLHGESVPIETYTGDSGTGWTARLQAGRLILRPDLRADINSGKEDAILRWYRREARSRICELTRSEAALLCVSPGPVSIRDQRTRWGSCSSSGTLSFSWRLLLAPLDVLDYVVVHELCHLLELNHSRRFWRHVERVRPDYRYQFEWLRDFGAELRRYRPVFSEPPAVE